jgi:hypothetical protein
MHTYILNTYYILIVSSTCTSTSYCTSMNYVVNICLVETAGYNRRKQYLNYYAIEITDFHGGRAFLENCGGNSILPSLHLQLEQSGQKLAVEHVG